MKREMKEKEKFWKNWKSYEGRGREDNKLKIME